MLAVLRLYKLIQLARCKFYTEAMGAILYCYALVRSKRPVGREVAFIQGYGKNPGNRSRIGPKFGWYGKVNQKSDRFANVPFHSRMNRNSLTRLNLSAGCRGRCLN